MNSIKKATRIELYVIIILAVYLNVAINLHIPFISDFCQDKLINFDNRVYAEVNQTDSIEKDGEIYDDENSSKQSGIQSVKSIIYKNESQAKTEMNLIVNKNTSGNFRYSVGDPEVPNVYFNTDKSLKNLGIICLIVKKFKTSDMD